MIIDFGLHRVAKHRVPFSLEGVPVVNRFVGRDTELRRLQEFFIPTEAGVATRRKVFVVHGLGGIGKTQLAIEFARRFYGKFSAVLWFNGSSRDELQQSFIEVAGNLPQDELSDDVSEALKQTKINVDTVVRGIKRWLALGSNQRWLIIIDNVDRDYHQKDDAQAFDIKEFFPQSDHGSILITSRLGFLERYGDGLNLGKVGDEQAKEILENNASKSIEGKQ